MGESPFASMMRFGAQVLCKIFCLLHKAKLSIKCFSSGDCDDAAAFAAPLVFILLLRHAASRPLLLFLFPNPKYPTM